MNSLKGKPTVAFLSPNEDMRQTMHDILEISGFTPVVENLSTIKQGNVDINKFLREKNPDVIVMDIRLPIKENLRFYESIKNSEAGRGRRFFYMSPYLDDVKREAYTEGISEKEGLNINIDEIKSAIEGPQIKKEREY